MMICPNCAKLMEDGAKFCDNCGTRLPEPIDPIPVTTPEPPVWEIPVVDEIPATEPNAPMDEIPATEPNAPVNEIPTTESDAPMDEIPMTEPSGPAFEPPVFAPAEPVGQTIFCPNCGARNSSQFPFCQDCGASLQENTQAEEIPEAQHQDVSGQGLQKVTKPARPRLPKFKLPKIKLPNLPKKVMVLGGAGLAALVIIGVVIALLSGGGADTYGLYIKDSEIFYTDFSKDGIVEVTSRLTNGEDIDADDLESSAAMLGYFVAFSDDGSRIFYPDRVDGDAEGLTIYYRDIDKPKREPVKIDTDIVQYAVNADGTQMIYMKGADGILYIHDLEDKEKIASDVKNFYVAEDFTKVCYINDEGNIYLWTQGEDSEKIASEVEEIRLVSEDLKTVYYMKEGCLYKQEVGAEDREKLTSEEDNVLTICPNGAVYYITTEENAIDLMDYVEDDKAEADADITEPESPAYPESPDYPYWWDYDTDEEYEAAKEEYNKKKKEYDDTCDQLKKEYNEAKARYQDKERRDKLRQELEEEEYELTQYSLYYYDGKEAILVTDRFEDDDSVISGTKNPLIIGWIYGSEEPEKVKLSEISSKSDVIDMIKKSRAESAQWHVISGAEAHVIEQEEAESFYAAPDGSAVYFLDDLSSKGEGDLYKLPIKNGEPGERIMIDSDVADDRIFFLTDSQLAYFKNYDYADRKGDLCVEGEEVDYDVYIYTALYQMEDDSLLYLTDWNDDKEYGTLKTYSKGTRTKVADDVHSFTMTQDDNILYLYDFSIKSYKGGLYLYNDGKPEKLEEDVTAIIPIYTFDIMGVNLYGW